MKQKQIKALFFDVDHTLFDHDLQDFPASAKVALSQLVNRGYRIYIATSRSEQELANAQASIQAFPFSGIITCGGAMIRIGEQVIETTALSPAASSWMMEYCRNHQVDVRWQSETECCFDSEPKELSSQTFAYLYHMVPEVKKWQQEHLLNILCYTDEIQAAYVAEQLQDASVVRFKRAIEVTGKGVNKATAMRQIAKLHGYDLAEIAAFGDGENDLRMIQEAGVGIAMGNGVPSLKAAADFVTKEIMDDGIYHACRTMGWIE